MAHAYDFSDFVASKELCDLTVRLRPAVEDEEDPQPPSKKQRGAKKRTPLPTPPGCINTPGHGVVLAGCSPVFKAQLARWREQPSSKRSSCPLITLQVVSPEQLGAARAVVEFMYKQQVPEDSSQQLLISMLQLADKYDVHSCATACCTALSRQQELEWDTAMQVLQLPPAHAESQLFSALFSKAGDKLQQELGDLEVAWASSEGRERFLALPLKGIELLLSDKRTRVAYENTVLVAATVWVQQHSNSLVAADKLRVAELIRLPYLSTFARFGLAATLSWLGTALGAGVVAAAMSCAAVISKDGPDVLPSIMHFAISNNWPASWKLGRRPASQHQKACLEWKVSLQELQHTYIDGNHTLLSPAAELGGLQWHVQLYCVSWSHKVVVALVQGLGSSLNDALQHKPWGAASMLPVAIMNGSLTAVRPGLSAPVAGAAVPRNAVQTFRGRAPNAHGVSAGDLWQLGAMPEWDPQRFKDWVGADGQLTLRLEVAKFL